MLEDIIKERRQKLNNLINQGINPYPSKIKRNFFIGEAVKNFNKLYASGKKINIAGRIIGLRDQGNLIFADIKDESGKIQIILKKNILVNFKLLKQFLDIGDFIAVSGILIKTKAGEKSMEAKTVDVIVKSLRPLPSSWYGFKDVEERFRKKYLDIILNEQSKERIFFRSKFIRIIRDELQNENFTEVETPMFQYLAGGAKAKPFITHHNALNIDFYLRIAPELFLKRLLVAGFEKIFEIGRVFRNEGIDRDHNPEFTMLELYWAYQNWEGLMAFIEKILKKTVTEVKIKNNRSKYFSKSKKWPKITYADSFKKYANIDIDKIKTKEIDEIFKKEVRPKINEPIFITHYPKSISPLAKSCPDNPLLTERFQLIIDGMEVVNGFSELNDPIDQRERMEGQEKMHRAGDQEASRLDEDFLEALEYGMPPAAGLGIGIDRLMVLLTDCDNIKEAIIFPTLKPK